jgi:orotidine-5'-phosphate decarboxylase
MNENSLLLTPLEAARERLIVALDVPEADAALALVKALAPTVGYFKVGLELFGSAGPELVRQMVARDARVFLDLKLHDIPATVARSVTVLGRLGVSLVTVHAAGGPEMMRQAVTAAAAADRPPGVLAVTALTSLDDEDLRAVGISLSPADLVLHRAQLAARCGVAGVVSSVPEAAAVRAVVADDFLIVTPGIRPAGAAVGDQKRVGTPARAITAGASHLVVGRPIRDAPDPVQAARDLVAEMAAAQGAALGATLGGSE